MYPTIFFYIFLMTDSKSITELQKKISNRDKLQADIYNYFNFINQAKKDIKELERFIWINCDHKWEYLNDGDYHSKIKYKCKHCDLYRNQYMYQ